MFNIHDLICTSTMQYKSPKFFGSAHLFSDSNQLQWLSSKPPSSYSNKFLQMKNMCRGLADHHHSSIIIDSYFFEQRVKPQVCPSKLKGGKLKLMKHISSTDIA
uniref:Uncharacterized protein n=1 Tax=Opuntia streptacantha TaxID=393608 RepID=A0A7C9DB58_OPUST